MQQAVELLSGRLAEARQRRDALTKEIVTIENALSSLRAYVEPGLAADGLGAAAAGDGPAAVRTAGPTTSVRAAVKAILDSEDRALAPAEIRNLIPAAVMNGKSAQQRTNSVRTALWSLRQKGEAILTDGDRTKSAKWATPAAPELPAEDGAGSFTVEGGAL